MLKKYNAENNDVNNFKSKKNTEKIPVKKSHKSTIKYVEEKTKSKTVQKSRGTIFFKSIKSTEKGFHI